MIHRLFKIYTSDNPTDAYTLIAYLESAGVPALFFQGNGILFDEKQPFENLGIKIFVDHSRKDQVLQIFKERLGAQGEAPYTGPIPIFTGKVSQNPTLVTDPRGPEHLAWNAGSYDPLMNEEVENSITSAEKAPKCPYCRAPREADARFCDQCGENFA